MQVFLIRKREQAKLSDLGIGAPERIVRNIAQLSLYIIVWCVIPESEIIGLYFFENENVTGSTYKRTLRYFLFLKLRGYPEDMIFQQDGASPHYSLEFRQYLDRKLLRRWMGRVRSIDWLARTQDLTPCDYFPCGQVKDLVYRAHLELFMTQVKDSICDSNGK